MNKTPDILEIAAGPERSGASMAASDVKIWFIREVLPLEAMLMHFLHRNWRNQADIEDLRQDVYAQILRAAKEKLPEKAKPFVMATARNLLIDRVRREQIVPIDAASDLDAMDVAADAPGPDRIVAARDTLRKLQTALDHLPPRCREVVILRRIEGLTRDEIALRLGVTEKTVADHITRGMCAIANELFGDPSSAGRDS
jgi:RNA polymerase sigma factor (sigma-70 family)